MPSRRRPVPRGWREENHSLDVHSTRSYGVVKGSGHYSRSRGKCACGAKWPASDRSNNLHYADVVDAWMDHVEREYYREQEVASDA